MINLLLLLLSLDSFVEREQLLTRAIVRGQRVVLNQMLADEFTCEVVGQFTLPRDNARHTLCTGLGHRFQPTGPLPEVIENFRGPRTAIINSFDAVERDGFVIVTTTQTYRNWIAFDRHERKSKVIDTWVFRDERWQLLKRVTEPQ